MQYRSDQAIYSAVNAGNDLAGLPALIREKQLRSDFIQIAHGTLWGWVSAGSFPAPVKLSSGVTAWKRSDLVAWVNGSWQQMRT